MTAATPPLNQWVHVAWVRVGSTNTLYLNGASTATATVSGTLSSTGGVTVGKTGSSGSSFNYFQGSVSNFRVTNYAVYTSNFVPSTSALTAISGTQLLTLQSATIVDNSANAFTITNTGTVTSAVATTPVFANKTTLSADQSPNGNNWTANNISTTAGVTYDSMTDVPTLTSATAANFATLNVLSQHASNVTTLSGGNLNVSGNGCLATISMPSGKWYWEATCTSADADQAVGILDVVESNTGAVSGLINPNRGVIYQANTNVRKKGTIVANYATFTNGDVLGLTFDASNNQIAFYKNNTLQGTITADAPIVSYVPHAQTLGGAFSYNFGQQPFKYTPPSGFVGLNTYNL